MKNGNALSFRVKRETEILFSPLIKATFPNNMDISAVSLLSESSDKYSPILVFLTSLFRYGVFLCFQPVCLHFNKRLNGITEFLNT